MKNNIALFLGTNGDIENRIIPESHDYHWFSKTIGADVFDVVHQDKLGNEYSLVIDDEGLLADRPTLNVLASWMYGTPEHGSPIVGDVLLLKEIMATDGLTLVGMSDAEADDMREKLIDHWADAIFGCRAALGDRLVRSSD